MSADLPDPTFTESPPRIDPPPPVPPTAAAVRTTTGGRLDRPAAAAVALTADAVWVQTDRWLRSVPLPGLAATVEWDGWELALVTGPGPDDRLGLRFNRRDAAQRWADAIHARHWTAVPTDPRTTGPVLLVKSDRPVEGEQLGGVEFSASSAEAADRGLRLAAGMRGADAVVAVRRHKGGTGRDTYHASGLAVRVGTADGYNRLLKRSFAEAVRGPLNGLLLLVALFAAITAAISLNGAARLGIPAPVDRQTAIADMWQTLALCFGWPALVLLAARLMPTPGRVRMAAVAAVAVVFGRWLAVIAGYMLALWAAGGTTQQPMRAVPMLVFNPLDLLLAVCGLVLGVRLWRMARRLPVADDGSPRFGRWATVGLAVTSVYAVGLVGGVGVSTFETFSHQLQPGVDPALEAEAIEVHNLAAAQADRGELANAAANMERAVGLWERLGDRPGAPLLYRGNLALALSVLGWAREQQGRPDDAIRLYARAVALADVVGNDPSMDDDYRQRMAATRRSLAALRGDQAGRQLDAKDRAAADKYEQAQVLGHKDGTKAEALFREAIRDWEEILSKATRDEYRTFAVGRLASAWLRLGDLLIRADRTADAEAALNKSIEYWERAVKGEPGRQLHKHNLEVARRTLDDVRDFDLQRDVAKLSEAERYADIAERLRRAVVEQEGRVRTATDREPAVRQLARRHRQLAWFLAHCPDARVRDTAAAVRAVDLATQLHPDDTALWKVAADIRYRHGDWAASLTALERAAPKPGEHDAVGWFLVAMNRFQLGQRDEARTAYRKGVAWVDQKERAAGKDPAALSEYEYLRPAVETYRAEAEELLDGKKPGRPKGAI